jgi:hypothetical protein
MLAFDNPERFAIALSPPWITRNIVKAMKAIAIVNNRINIPPFYMINIVHYCEENVNTAILTISAILLNFMS